MMDVSRLDLSTANLLDRNNSGLAKPSNVIFPTKQVHANSSLSNRYANPNIHLTNRSNYDHNIISGAQNAYSPRLNVSPREIVEKVAFRKKGLTDIVNLQYHNGVHANYEHRNLYIQDPMIYGKKRG